MIVCVCVCGVCVCTPSTYYSVVSVRPSTLAFYCWITASCSHTG